LRGDHLDHHSICTRAQRARIVRETPGTCKFQERGLIQRDA